MILADILRWIFIGQTILLIFLVIARIAAVFVIDKDRPGRKLGVISAGLSYMLCLAFIVATVWHNLGESLTWRTVLGLAVTCTGVLGYSLLVAHALLHTRKAEKYIDEHIIRSHRSR